MRHAWLSQLLICHSQLEAPTSGEHWSPDFKTFSNQVKSKRAYPCTTTPEFLAPAQPSPANLRSPPSHHSPVFPADSNLASVANCCHSCLILGHSCLEGSSIVAATIAAPALPALPCPAQPTSGAHFSPAFPADSSTAPAATPCCKRSILTNPTQSASTSYSPLEH